MERLRRWRQENPALAAKVNARARALRRARIAGVKTEPIDRHIVFERDEWKCGICGEHVPLEQASLDHIVPLAKGGDHLYANCQTAHLKCNLSKGARLMRAEV